MAAMRLLSAASALALASAQFTSTISVFNGMGVDVSQSWLPAGTVGLVARFTRADGGVFTNCTGIPMTAAASSAALSVVNSATNASVTLGASTIVIGGGAMLSPTNTSFDIPFNVSSSLAGAPYSITLVNATLTCPTGFSAASTGVSVLRVGFPITISVISGTDTAKPYQVSLDAITGAPSGQVRPANAQAVRVRVVATLLQNTTGLASGIFSNLFNWPVGLPAPTSTVVGSNEIGFDVSLAGAPQGVYDLVIPGGRICSSAACTTLNALSGARIVVGAAAVALDDNANPVTIRSSTASTITFVTNTRVLTIRQFGELTALATFTRFSQLYGRLFPNSDVTQQDVLSALGASANTNASSIASGLTPASNDFPVRIDGLSTGRFLFQRNRSSGMADQYSTAQTTFVDLEVIIDRVPPVGVNVVSNTKVYVGDVAASVVIPTTLFTDAVSPSSSITVVSVVPATDAQGFTFTSAVGARLGTAALVAPRIVGGAGSPAFIVTARDEAGNVATAVFSVPVAARPSVTLAVADKRGVFSASLRTGGAAALNTVSNSLDLTVVVSLADSASNVISNGLTNNGIVITGLSGYTINSPVVSGGNRVFTFTVSTPIGGIADGAAITMQFSAGAAVRDSDGAAAAASNTASITVDKTPPVGSVKDVIEVSRVGAVFYAVLPPAGAAALFTDNLTPNSAIAITSATTAQAVGLTVTTGVQGVANIAGIPNTLPSASTVTFCNSNASATMVVFTVTGMDEAGNSATATACVRVAVAPANAPTLTISRVPMIVTQTATTLSVGTTAALDASAAFVYTGNSRSVSISLETPDLSSNTAAPTDELLTSTYSGTGTLTAYVQDSVSRTGTLLLDAGSDVLSAAQVTTFLQSVSYRLQRARATIANRNLRITVRDSTGILAGASRVITLLPFNSPPRVSNMANSTYTEATVSETVGTAVAAAVALADDDDTFMSSAVVSITTSSDSVTYAACDSTRDFLQLPSSYAAVARLFGVWDVNSCSLTLKAVTGNSVSLSDMNDALRAIVYKNLVPRDPTNRNYVPGAAPFINTRQIVVIIRDAAKAGQVSVPAASNTATGLLTIIPVANPATFNLAACYGPGGLFFEADNNANVKQITVGSTAYNVRKFAAKVDGTTSTTTVIPIRFNLTKVVDGVFASGQITQVDARDPPSSAASISFACLVNGAAGACPTGVSITTDLSQAGASYNNVSGLSVFAITVSNPSTVTLGEFGVRMTYGTITPLPTADFYVDIRNLSCPFNASGVPTTAAPSTFYPFNDRCVIAPVSIPVPSVTPVPVVVGTFAASAASFAQRTAALSSANTPIQQQITALQADRQAARGGIAVTFPVNAFSSVNALSFVAAPAAASSQALLPPVSASEVVDTSASIKLTPACTTFSQPVQVCVYVGDTDAGYARTLRVASQVDCVDESKGYGAFEVATGVVWNPVTGSLCGNVTHFSLVAPVLVPVPTTPTVTKMYQMGGSCPNECSGHGYCRENGQCVCFSGFTGYDCTRRSCPAAESWTQSAGVAHQSSECAGAGTCDRTTGTCKCFPGYEGTACQRTTCPNDCSGNGRCRTLGELPNVQASGYSSWEARRVQVCSCDGGFAGADCSQRLCPRGDDPDTAFNDVNRQVQTLTLDFGTIPSQYAGVLPASVYSVDKFALQFTTLDGTNYTTPRIDKIFDPTNGGTTRVAAALQSLPGFAVSDVTVTAAPGSNSVATPSTYVAYRITFDGTSMLYSIGSGGASASNTAANTVTGNQLLLQCPMNADGSMGCTAAGCRPLFSQLRLLDTSSAAGSGITVSANAILSQPSALTPGDAALPGRWGVIVTITVAANGVNGGLTYSATSQIYESATGSLGNAETLPATPLPPASLRKAVPILYGLSVNFDTALVSTGTFEFKWRLPTCSVAVTQAADVNYEAAECSNRGVCDRAAGTCACFPGYAGYSCSQQTIII